MPNKFSQTWAPITVLIDADFLDQLTLELSTHFGKQLGRTIPQADLCHWLDCLLLDAGVQPDNNEVQVHFLHSKTKEKLDHLSPSRFADDLNNLSFQDNLGRFSLFAFPVEEVVTTEEFFLQSLTMLADAKEVKRLIVVGNMQSYGEQVEKICDQTDGKEIVVFTMFPTQNESLHSEILGYSLMSALGINANEL